MKKSEETTLLSLEMIKKRFKVYLDGEYEGKVFYKDLVKCGIHWKDDENPEPIRITAQEAERLRMLIYSKNLEYAASLLAGSEYAASDIRMKLKKREVADEVIEGIIAWLYDNNYLNDSRYAEAYIRSYAGRKSRELIKRELEYKGVSPDDLNDLFDQIYKDESIDETELLLDMLEKKYGGQDFGSDKVRVKAASYLLRKGFKMGAVNDAIKRMQKED